jgi:large subunit ribosomal protein L1
MVHENTIKAVNEDVESAPKRKFTESVDLVINLKNIDLSQPKNRITESIVLPKGRGKATKIGVFAKGDLAIKSQSGGADLVISPEDIDKMSSDRKLIRSTTRDIDFFIAEAPLMPSIGKSFGPILGPKGKMPDPIPSSADPTPIINRLKRTVKVRTKDKTTFHSLVGNLSMSVEDIAANIEALLSTVESKLQNGTQNIASVYVKTTMGPAVSLM